MISCAKLNSESICTGGNKRSRCLIVGKADMHQGEQLRERGLPTALNRKQESSENLRGTLLEQVQHGTKLLFLGTLPAYTEQGKKGPGI